MRVGFITYDKKINFYNIKSNLTQPQQLTVGDVDDMFVPLVDGLMCNVKESEAVIDSLLEQIPLMFAETRLASLGHVSLPFSFTNKKN